MYNSTCVTLHRQPLAVGGLGGDEKPTNVVYKYNQESNSWDIFSRMATSRYWSIVAVYVLPCDDLIGVGSNIDTDPYNYCNTNVVEIASVFSTYWV